MSYFGTEFFGISAGILSAASSLPYVYSIIRGRTKPSGPSWAAWALIGGVIFVSSYFSGATWQVLVLPAWLFLYQSSVALLSLKYGHNVWDHWNIISISGACLSIVLWVITGNPVVALCASVFADLLASIPNFRHLWSEPGEENRLGWTLGFCSAFFGVFAMKQWSIAESGFAVYFFLNMSGTLVLVWRPFFWRIFFKNKYAI